MIKNHEKIAELNDRCRKYSGEDHGFDRLMFRHVMTSGINDLPEEEQLAIREKVKLYTDFNEDIDPFGTHEIGAFEYNGKRIFWQITCYDPDMQYASEDPADASKTIRVLTIMLSHEY